MDSGSLYDSDEMFAPINNQDCPPRLSGRSRRIRKTYPAIHTQSNSPSPEGRHFLSSNHSTHNDSSQQLYSYEPNNQGFELAHEKEEQQSAGREWRFYGTFATLSLLNFVCAIDATILAVALPAIATNLKGTTAIQAFWCGTSFLLCSTVFQPSFASLSHIFGRKSVLLTALFFFTIGSVLCAIANTIAVLLAGRCVQGVGSGGLVALTYVIVTDMVSLRERGKWFSFITLQWAIGTIIGPIIGGTIAEKTTWRWIFWINVPFCVLGAIGVPICLRLAPVEGSIRSKLQAFDWFGSFVFVAALTSFLIPLTWGGIMYDWNHWRTLVPLLLGVGGLILFVVYSAMTPVEPLIRRSLFGSRTSLVAYFGTVIHGMMITSLLYYMPLYFEVAKGYSAVMSGVAIFPFTFTVAPVAMIIGIVITKTGKYRIYAWSGWVITAVGMALLIILKANTPIYAWVLITLIPGIGFGFLFSAQSFAVQAAASNADLPFAGALYSFFRSLGQTIGVAITGVIFQNMFKAKIEDTKFGKFADDWSKDASALVQVVKTWSDNGEKGLMKEVVVEAYVDSLRIVWIIMCGFVLIAMIASFIFMKELTLDRELETEQAFMGRAKQMTEDEEAS